MLYKYSITSEKREYGFSGDRGKRQVCTTNVENVENVDKSVNSFQLQLKKSRKYKAQGKKKNYVGKIM